MIIMTIVPTIKLKSAERWADIFALEAAFNPMRLPTRLLAATPIPNGIVFRTDERLHISDGIKRYLWHYSL
jgi:hypothetical protein